jgi:diketogulonate reductase-like aldo/keto reductase
MASHVLLRTGARMPIIGLGTWQSSPEEVVNAVEHAIDVGYRHIDTAFAYQNEKSIGEAIRNKIQSRKVERQDLFVVTKVKQYNGCCCIPVPRP